MRVDKGKRFELCYWLLRLQPALICDTRIGYCNPTPAALVAHAPVAGDRVKYLRRGSPGGILAALWGVTAAVSVTVDDQITAKE